MFIGQADEPAPAELKEIQAYPVAVPLAPLTIGNPDEQAPLELSNVLAHAAN
jgi:hypothetical protein